MKIVYRAAFWLGLIGSAHAQLVSQMTQATLPLSGQELVYIVQNGQPRQVSSGSFPSGSACSVVLGCTYTAPVTFNGAGTGLSVANSGVFGSGGAAPITLSSGSLSVAGGQNLTVSLGGNGHTLTFAGTGGTGTQALLTVTTGGSTLDLSKNVNSSPTLLRTTNNFIAGPFTVGSSYSTATSPLALSGSVSGSTSNTNSQIMQWSFSGDTATAWSSGSQKTLAGIDLEYVAGVAATHTMTGARSPFNVHITQPAQSGNCINNDPGGADCVGAIYQGGQVAADVSFSEGGTGLTAATALGANYSWDLYCRNNGAPNFYVNKCMEADMLIAAGGSAVKNMGFDVELLSSSAVQGDHVDAAYTVGSQVGASVGLKTGVQFGSFDGQDPFGSTSRLLHWSISGNPATKVPQAATGIDLTLGEISGCSFTARDFCMKDSAGLQVYGGLLSSISGGFSLDTTGYKIAFASLASGTCATACTQGDWFKDATSGMIVKATTVVGGNVTVAAAENAGWEASAPGGAVTVTNMNPDRSGQSFTVNVTATQQLNLNVGTTNATAIGIGNANTTLSLGATLVKMNGTSAVSCPAGVTAATVTVANGIVTHC